ncbi:pentatricopeptide repeat-containing protein At3g57430, chloroplastic-like isoform X2 [Macadamia integrifolia]|uniref:pentatricopeptide repeat-containing protein At3g57430, chloroplastic-like isoform X2 n=1 Tax=Macadamia integrifolia TaxID=60698 RepID=UPI001C4EDBB7|nr:pentatricopeptide repeat-containing protein At3g57430, chloroplastic-like isoform X2 [Macadamia integrifolia]XP_042516589.1 pentatricopeptide repeat-containing protein At3g57430, chloroplastic-like isoform X2 [Macadamia integrifolia]
MFYSTFYLKVLTNNLTIQIYHSNREPGNISLWMISESMPMRLYRRMSGSLDLCGKAKGKFELHVPPFASMARCGGSISLQEPRSIRSSTIRTSESWHALHLLVVADKFGNEILEKDVVSWTSMISMKARQGFIDLALSYFLRMRRLGIDPNETTYSTTIGVCCQLRRIDVGMSMHCLILKKGFLTQLFVASGLVTMYSKCGYVEEARQIFDRMLYRDAVTWNSMIAACSQNFLNWEAICLFRSMLKSGNDGKLLVNNFTFASVFRACAGLECNRMGKSLHGYAIKLGFSTDVFVGGSIIDMYSKSGSLDIGQCVFNQMGKRDLVAWNTMITAYSQNYNGEEAIALFYQMQSEGFLPNETTFSCVIKASSMMSDIAIGRCFHAKTLMRGYSSDVFVGTALVDMYSKYFAMEDAEEVFGDMNRSVVSFNALITGYSLSGRYEEALRAYVGLCTEDMKPDFFTFTGLFSSCSVLGALHEGAQVHAHSVKFGLDSNVTVGNSLMNFYAKCGIMDGALKAFEFITTPNSISWAGIISGFAQNGEGEKAFEYFCKMHRLSEEPDEFAFSSILATLANWAATEQGRHLHGYMIKTGLGSTLLVGSALVDMYSKSGIAEDSFKVFCEMPEKNVVSWNSMIIGYAQNGFSDKALLLFQEMRDTGVIPTCITFVGVLSACSHAGLIEEGINCYNLMVYEYRILPSVEHCTCMVDLLGRAGYLNEAETFIYKSPFPQEPGMWRTLLAACGVHKNSDVGVRASQHCLWLEPQDSFTYVILSNIYASKQLWCEVTRIRDMMKDMCVEKEPGCSWIEVRNIVMMGLFREQECFQHK